MGQALRAVVAVYTGREVDAATEDEVLAFPWAKMGFQHVQKVRTALAEKYAPATANKILSALRGVLHACLPPRPDERGGVPEGKSTWRR